MYRIEMKILEGLTYLKEELIGFWRSNFERLGQKQLV